MRVIILAGGYGTRLQRDLQNNDPNGEYKHLLGMPKALLPVGKRPLISHWMELLRACKSKIDGIYVVSNDFYFKKFKDWSKDYPDVVVINDGTKTNETRLGAVACLNLPIIEAGFDDDVTVIGGDTLFYDDFNLDTIWKEFRRRQQHNSEASLVLTCLCSDEETTQVGILETDNDRRITAFLEKPAPSETSSRKQCPCFYVLARATYPLIKIFLQEKQTESLKARDATGNFIRYLQSRYHFRQIHCIGQLDPLLNIPYEYPVYTFDISARFDVGALSTYKACHQYFLQRESSPSNENGNFVIQQRGTGGENMAKIAKTRLPATYVPGFHDEKAVERMQYNVLGNTGLEVSIIGLGGAPFGNIYMDHPISVEKGSSVLRKALQNGINYIDTAPYYGDRKSETMLGKILKDIPREAYYIATKVGRYKPDIAVMFDFSASRTISSVDESLKLLGLDYVDIIQIHDIEFAPSLDIVLNECLPALAKIQQAGKARFIGITGYPLDIYKNVLERSCVQIDTVLSYCHLTLHDSSLLDLLPYFRDKGLGVVNAAPISMGLLSDRGPRDWHPASADIKDACRNAALYCQSKNVNISRLAMYYSIKQNAVDITLVGMDTEEIVEMNLDIVRGSLTDFEKETTEYIIAKFFQPLEKCSWEEIQLKDYWAELEALNKAS